MDDFCIRRLHDTIGGRLQMGSLPPLGGDIEPLGRVVVDVGSVSDGDIFWALESSPHDSAACAEEAFMRGALGAVVSGRSLEPWAGRFSIEVEDTCWALWQLASTVRRRYSGCVIAVVGPTSGAFTRNVLHAVLERRYQGIAPHWQRDDQMGVPLGLLELNASLDYGVFQFGCYQKARIQAHSHLCCPEIAVIYSTVVSHGTEADVKRAEREAELAANLPKGSWLVLNGDKPELCRLAESTAARVLLVGRGSHCDVVASEINRHDDELVFAVDGMQLCIPVHGRHALHVALAACAVGRVMQLSMAEVREGLESFSPQLTAVT